VHVVKQQHERLGHRERLEQLPDAALDAVALVSAPRLHAVCQRWEDPCEVGDQLLVERVAATRLERLQVFVEGVHEHPERKLALQLRSAAREHEMALPVRARGQLGQQACLPDARLPDQLERTEPFPLELGERAVDHA